MAAIRVRWLKNHGVRIFTTTARGTLERFEPHAGTVAIAEAAAALGTYEVKLRRLIGAKKITSRTLRGARRIPISELWRLRRNRSVLADARKMRSADRDTQGKE